MSLAPLTKSATALDLVAALLRPPGRGKEAVPSSQRLMNRDLPITAACRDNPGPTEETFSSV